MKCLIGQSSLLHRRQIWLGKERNTFESDSMFFGNRAHCFMAFLPSGESLAKVHSDVCHHDSSLIPSLGNGYSPWWAVFLKNNKNHLQLLFYQVFTLKNCNANTLSRSLIHQMFSPPHAKTNSNLPIFFFFLTLFCFENSQIIENLNTNWQHSLSHLQCHHYFSKFLEDGETRKMVILRCFVPSQ